MKYFVCLNLRTGAFILLETIILLSACTKEKSSCPPRAARKALAPTAMLAGSWMMHGIKDTNQVDVYDSIFSIRDTTLAITVINDSTIALGNVMFNYIIQSSNDSMLYFWHVYTGTFFEEASVTYYFHKDSIVYDDLKLPTTTGYVETRYNTYK